MKEVDEELFELSRDVVAGMGYTLVDVEAVIEHGRFVLRFYIDHPRAVGTDDCAAVSRELGYLLDGDWQFDDPYVLEVSSPGLDHRLKKEREYAHFAGRSARLVLRRPAGSSNVVEGKIAGAEDGSVRIVGSDGDEMSIPLSEIARARLLM